MVDDDTEQFDKMVKENTSPSDKKLKSAPVGKDSSEVDSSEPKSLKDTGASTQYALMLGGYGPVGPTIPTLLPGIYDIQSVNGQIVFTPNTMKTDSLLRLPDSRSDELINDVIKFWGLRDKFVSAGYRHSRGYFVFGPPGSGKTCTVYILMQELVKRGGVSFIGAKHPETLSRALKEFRLIEPDKPAIVVLEDFDSLIYSYGDSEYLSLLDGENSIDNCVYFATTNYPDRFDSRIFNRPGRFFDRVFIGMPTPAARKVYLESKEIVVRDDIGKIVDMTDGFSIDHLKAVVQSVYIEERDLDKSLEKLRSMFKLPKLDRENEIGLRSKRQIGM